MKKYSWIVALLLALTLAFVFASCGGETDPDKGKEGDKGKDGGTLPEGDGLQEDGSYLITNPKFTGWGGLGSAGENNTFNFTTGASNNCRATYVFPAAVADFTNFTITYNITRSTGADNNPDRKMKLVIQDSSNGDWSNPPATTFKNYKDYDTDKTAETYSHAISEKNQITFEHNYGDHNKNTDGSTSFTITFTKIVFTK